MNVRDKLSNTLEVGDKLALPRDVLAEQILCEVKEINTLGAMPQVICVFQFPVPVNPGTGMMVAGYAVKEPIPVSGIMH